MPDDSVIRLGVTGTDTEIGKTVVSCALLAMARARGMRIATMKPLETGVFARTRVDGPSMRSDAERLRAAAGVDDALELVRPISLVEPLAPMVAARRAHVQIDLAMLDRVYTKLSAGREFVLVEGAGGLLVPITREVSYAQLFVRWNCELVIVSGNRLGVINHTLLTAQAAVSAGLRIRAIVLTSLTGRDASVAEATNFDALCELLPDIPLVRFPWVDRWEDPDALCAVAEGTGLAELLLPSPNDERTHAAR
jgi:dethiobiotin synthetase